MNNKDEQRIPNNKNGLLKLMNERPTLIITNSSSSLKRRLIISTLAKNPEIGIAVISTFGSNNKLNSSTI